MGGVVLHHGRGGGGPNGIEHVHDGVIPAGADVQNGRAGTGPTEGQFDRPGHIHDVGEVATLATVAVDDDRLTCLDPPAEALQGKVGSLAGSPDGEEPQGEKPDAVEL